MYLLQCSQELVTFNTIVATQRSRLMVSGYHIGGFAVVSYLTMVCTCWFVKQLNLLCAGPEVQRLPTKVKL